MSSWHWCIWSIFLLYHYHSLSRNIAGLVTILKCLFGNCKTTSIYIISTNLLKRMMLNKIYSPLSQLSLWALIMISRTLSGDAHSMTTGQQDQTSHGDISLFDNVIPYRHITFILSYPIVETCANRWICWVTTTKWFNVNYYSINYSVNFSINY